MDPDQDIYPLIFFEGQTKHPVLIIMLNSTWENLL